jgi:hypothetical protein
MSVYNSPASEFYQISDESNKVRLDSIVTDLFRCFGINRYQNFLYSFNQNSLIQEGLDRQFTKPIIEIHK